MVYMVFRSTATQKNFYKRITQQGILEEDLQFFSGRQKVVNYVKMLNDLTLAQEGHRLCGEEWIFQQDNAAIHNESITKKYFFEQKIRLLDHPASSPKLNPIENLSGLIVAKF